MVPQGTFSYAGFQAQGSFSAPRSTSSSPDPITAQFYPGTVLPPVGDVMIAFGGNYVTFPMCRFSRSEISVNDGGRFLDVTFEDRRWMWRTKPLFCSFNTDEGLRRTAKQIVEYIVFNVLGEVTANVFAFSGDTSYPDIEADGEPAIEILERILGDRGYIVTLSLQNNLVIHRKGVGYDIPEDPLLAEADYSQEFKAIPQTLRIISEPIKWHDYILLEPVGEETDGRILPIESLSYKPANGWAKENPKTFSNVAVAQRELARRCIWKMYRLVGPFSVKKPDNYPLDPELFEHVSVSQVLPLMSGDLMEGKETARVMGFFYDQHSTRKNNAEMPEDFDADYFDESDTVNTANHRVYQGKYSVDNETGIVKFDQPVYYQMRKEDGTIHESPYRPAALVLLCCFGVRQSLGQFIRHFYTYNPAFYTAMGHEESFIMDGLKYKILVNTDQDKAYFESQAAIYAGEKMTQYNSHRSVTAKYKGFRFDIQPDGLTNMVRFQRDGGGSTFTVDWNAESGMDRLTYKEKVQRLKDLAREKAANQMLGVVAKARKRNRVQ